MTVVNCFLSLPSDLHQDLRQIAEHRGISLTDFLVQSLVENAEEYRAGLWEDAPAPWLASSSTLLCA